MKKVAALLIVGVFMLLVAASANAETFKGFLANVTYGKAGMDLAGHDLTLNPDSLPIVAMLVEEAALKSGYGIFMTFQMDVQFPEYVFYALDAKGSDLAKDIVGKTQEQRGVYVTVEGTLDKGKKLLTVASMKEEAHKPIPILRRGSD